MSVVHTFILNGKFKFAFAAFLALTFFAVQPINVSAKPKKAKYGTIKIQTNPGGLLLTAVNAFKRGFATHDGQPVVKDPEAKPMEEDQVGHESVTVHRSTPQQDKA